jgi:hypothetical protein
MFSSRFFIGQILPESEFKNQKYSVYGGFRFKILKFTRYIFWVGLSINSQKYRRKSSNIIY